MPARLLLNVDNPASLLGATAYGPGALLRWERASAQGGPYAEGGTVALVAGTTQYEVWDASGTSATWYRTRVSNATNTVQSEYGVPFEPATVAYATVDEFLKGFEAARPAASRYNRILDCLVEASDAITAAVGWDFYPHPVSGTEARIYHGTGDKRLHVHQGIVSLSLVEIAMGPDLAYQPLAASDWYLEPLVVEPGEPYDHLMLAEFQHWWYIPYGQRRVRLTGQFGYTAIPRRVRSGTIALARQLYRADSTTPGGMPGPDEFGTIGPIPHGWPDATYRAVDYYRRKFWCHV